MPLSRDELWRPPPSGTTRLGPYVLRAEIGRGGTGSVFVAERHDAGDARRFAIKVLRADRAAPRRADDLIREAATGSRLHHPNIAEVVELLALDEPAVVMAYVHGESLASITEAVDHLPYGVVVAIGAAVADALAYAHREAGVVHRDVSPQNLLIGYDGVPRLVDFGIAAPAEDPHPDETGTVRGRPAYMSPEQRRGDPVDGRADVYALGMVLYELAVGSHPWRVAGGRVDRPPHPGARRPDLPAALWQVIAKATEPELDARYADAAALRDDLRAIGGDDALAALRALLEDAFGERRREKERILADHVDLGGDTEAIAVTTRPPTAVAAPRRRSGAALAAAAGVIATAIAVVALRAARSTRADGGIASAHGAPCVLVVPPSSPGDRDATWTAARIIGLALDRAPGAAPVHGYRAQDRFGWNEAGLRQAEAACTAAHADAFVAVGVANGTAVSAAIDGARIARDEGSLGASARAVADEVIARLGLPVTRAPVMPALDDRGTQLYFEAREDLVLDLSTKRGDLAVAVLVRDYPAVEDGYLGQLIGAWWAGALEADPPAPPAGASARVLAWRAAVLALARQDPRGAIPAIEPQLREPGLAEDALGLYIAGEVYVHAGRNADGVRYLDQALAADPQLSPALYHLFERRLAVADRAGVEQLADLWGRIDPSGVHDDEYRAHAALGAGDLDAAIHGFEALLQSEASSYVLLNRPGAGLVHAMLLAGRDAEAIELGRRFTATTGGPPAVSSVLIEPILYARALAAGDTTAIATWEAAVRVRLDVAPETANHWQLRYVMAILDTLGGRAGARARWIGDGPPPDLPRRYRHATFAAVFEVLEAHERGAPAPASTDAWTALLAAGVDHERAGDRAAATASYQAALESSSSGEFDCIAAAALARVAADPAAHDAACARILAPHVPRAYCNVLRPTCARE